MPPSLTAPGEGPLPLLLDSTVLNNFLKIGRLPLLRTVFPSSLRVAAQVYDEMRAGGFEAPLQDGVGQGWLRLVAPESGRETALYGELGKTLGAGEAASLAIAICRQWAMATDDRAARRAAESAAVPLTGSVGILVTAVRAGIIALEEGDRFLQQMRRHGYRFPVGSLEGLA